MDSKKEGEYAVVILRTKMDKMPDSCKACEFGKIYGCVGDVHCMALNEYFTNNTRPPYKERPDECPLIESGCDLVKREDVMKTVEGVCNQYNMCFDPDYEIKRAGSFGVDFPKAIMAIPAADEISETVNNDAYLYKCECPKCGNRITRGREERTFFCDKCGAHLHQRAFTDKEEDEAEFEREMDEYEDL